MPPPGAGPLLVRVPNWLGDLVLAWPVLEAAGRGDVVFLGPAAFAPLLQSRFPSSRTIAWARARRYASVGAIRDARPRAALLLTESFSSALLLAMAGVPRRIGYGAEGRSFLLTHRVRRPAAARATPRAGEYRALARAAGLDVAPGEPSLTATDEERGAAWALLRDAWGEGRGAANGSIAGSGAAYLVVAPGAAYGPAKQWGAERFGETAASIARTRGASVVAVGAAGDAEASSATLEAARRHGAVVVDLTGRTDLPTLVGILAGAVLVLSNDSGVMHLAAALGKPTIAIFGSTSPVWTSAASPWVASLYAGYPCSPCYRRTCPIGYGCLRAVAPSAVEAAAETLLSRG